MEKKADNSVQSVDRALALLEVLSQGQSGCRLTDLARHTGLALSTVHRLLTTLEMRDFVHFSQTSGCWHVGVGAFSVGSAFEKDRNFSSAVVPYLRALRDKTRETANLGIIENDEVILIDRVDSREISRAVSQIGGRTPMAASGMGKAALSSYSDSHVREILVRCGMTRFTNNTTVDANVLARDLASVKSCGFALDNEEYSNGVRCVAAPVYNRKAEVVCMISISGLPSRITDERIPDLGATVRATAAQITAVLQ